MSISCSSELRIEVVDDGAPRRPDVPNRRARVPVPVPRSGGGHGLVGMRERVTALGGRVTAAPLPDRGFRVSAELPLDEAS